MMDGISVFNLIIAVLENLIGQVDAELPVLLEIILTELKFVEDNKESISYTRYKSMVL